jgi:hypothetical protein
MDQSESPLATLCDAASALSAPTIVAAIADAAVTDTINFFFANEISPFLMKLNFAP